MPEIEGMTRSQPCSSAARGLVHRGEALRSPERSVKKREVVCSVFLQRLNESLKHTNSKHRRAKLPGEKLDFPEIWQKLRDTGRFQGYDYEVPSLQPACRIHSVQPYRRR